MSKLEQVLGLNTKDCVRSAGSCPEHVEIQKIAVDDGSSTTRHSRPLDARAFWTAWALCSSMLIAQC